MSIADAGIDAALTFEDSGVDAGEDRGDKWEKGNRTTIRS